MRDFFFNSIILLILISGALPIYAQTTTNPDISFIGDMRINGYRDAPADTTVRKPPFSFEELELAAGSYLNPYSRADLTISVSGSGGTDIEEAYATVLRGLPWNLQVKAGKYLVDFGKLNTQHAHQWSWIERPLMFRRFFGDEGLKVVGADVTTFVPIGSSAITISGNVLQGGFLIPEEQISHPQTPAGSGRLSLFSPAGDKSSIDFGISGLFARLGYPGDHWAVMGDMDFKYKWKPDIYHSLVFIMEGLINRREIEDSITTTEGKKINSFGAFSSIDYQFRRRFDIGAFVDYSQSPIDQNDHQTGFGAFGGFSVAEETYRVGLLLRQDQGTGIDKAYQSIIVQLLWSLGPHKPHTF